MIRKASCAVRVVLRTTGHEVFDDITFEFVRHLPQEVAYGNHGFAFSPFVDDGVGVVIEDAFVR